MQYAFYEPDSDGLGFGKVDKAQQLVSALSKTEPSRNNQTCTF